MENIALSENELKFPKGSVTMNHYVLKYKNTLLDNVLPFWLSSSMDT